MLTQEDIKIIRDLLQQQGVQFDEKLANLERNLKMDIAQTEASLRREIHTSEDNIRKEMNQRFDNVDEKFSNLVNEITKDIMPLYATNEELEKVKTQLDNHINNHKFG